MHSCRLTFAAYVAVQVAVLDAGHTVAAGTSCWIERGGTI